MRKERKRRTSWWPWEWGEGVTLRASDKKSFCLTHYNGPSIQERGRGSQTNFNLSPPLQSSESRLYPLFKFGFCFWINSYRRSTCENAYIQMWCSSGSRARVSTRAKNTSATFKKRRKKRRNKCIWQEINLFLSLINDLPGPRKILWMFDRKSPSSCNTMEVELQRLNRVIQ